MLLFSSKITVYIRKNQPKQNKTIQKKKKHRYYIQRKSQNLMQVMEKNDLLRQIPVTCIDVFRSSLFIKLDED